MASRTDQLHSQQFMSQRVVAALAMRDADAATAPWRRIGGSLLAGLLLAALGVAAGGVYAVLRPGADPSWRDGNAVIVEAETGARFVYRAGVLYPVLNYSSARLLLAAGAPTVRASRSALSGVPRGRPLGIPGAPDALPQPVDLLAGAWTLCSRPSGGHPPESVLMLGGAPPMDPLGARAVVAADPSGALHLLWNHRRFAIVDPGLVLAAFAWPRQAAVQIAPALLNAIPAGPDLGPVPVPPGDLPSEVDGYRVGQVFMVENQSGGRQYGLALAAGVADLTPVQADLLLAAGANGPGGRPLAMAAAQYASAPRGSSLVPTGDAAPPTSTPPLSQPGSGTGVCATFPDGGGVPALGLAGAVPRGPGELPAGLSGTAPAPLDLIDVAPGRAAVVEAVAGPTAGAGALALVTDGGLRYPVPNTDVLALLGFGGVRPLRMPAGLVALVPAGRALDPAAAALPAPA